MKTLRAVHEIHMTVKPGVAGDKSKGLAPVRPEVKAIKPGTRFKAQNEAQEAELLAIGAARVAEDPKDDEVVDISAKPEKAKAKPGPKPKAEKPVETTAEGGEGEGEGEGEGGEGDGSELV